MNGNGIPLAIKQDGANNSDHRQLMKLTVVGCLQVGGQLGRLKQAPDELYADADDNSEVARTLFRELGIESRIRERGETHFIRMTLVPLPFLVLPTTAVLLVQKRTCHR